MDYSINQITALLSPRETQVLVMISKGEKREDIAHQLRISKLTYDGYRKNIRQKLNIKSQADWTQILYLINQTNTIL